MKNLLIMASAFLAAATLWLAQNHRRALLLAEDETLARRVQAAAEQGRASAAAESEAGRKAKAFEVELDRRRAPLAPAAARVEPVVGPLPPDPVHQGGWPKGASYFYLPKSQLTNLNCRLLKEGRLTEEAASLLGMSPPERVAVDQAFADLMTHFRQLELARIQAVPAPDGWTGSGSGFGFESAGIYHIPDLSAEADAMKQTLARQLEGAVGPSRAELVNQAAESFLRQNVDDLGAGDRTIGFLWQAEPDGTKSLWYGTKDPRHGDGSFQRIPPDLEPDSQIAVYARLLGVSLPGR